MPAASSPSPTKDEIEGFSLAVSRTAKQKAISYLDALVYVCERSNIEPEVAATLLNGVVKEKIQRDAEALNFLKSKKSRLPIG